MTLLVTATLVMAACSSDEPTPDASGSETGSSAPAEPSGTLRVFAFEDSLIPEVLEPFQELYPDVEVQSAAFGSGDEALTKLESGFQADVVEVCIREVPRYSASGVLMPLDTGRLDRGTRCSPPSRPAVSSTATRGWRWRRADPPAWCGTPT